MRRSVCREDQNIIEISNYELVENVIESRVNIVLEGCGPVREAEGHNYVFVVTVARAKYSLLFVSLLNPNPVVRILDIEFVKNLSSCETV
jgi:hypothetical protein